MKDYEQLYYDALYEIKQLKSKNELLKDELDIYKSMLKNKDLKEIIVNAILEYKKKCDSK